MNTSTAPLAESEDFDNLSLKTKSNSGSAESIAISLPDENHNVPPSPRKRAPSPEVYPNNHPSPVKEEFQNQNEEDKCSCLNPAFALAFVYFCGAMSFLLGLNVRGLSMLRYPWVGNLLQFEYQNLRFENGVIILQLMWCLHFVLKASQVLFVNRYHGKLNCVSILILTLYHTFFGIWIGWSLNFHLKYRVPRANFLVPGILVFLIGEIGNFYCHWSMRKEKIACKPSGIPVAASDKHKPNLLESIRSMLAAFGFEVLCLIGFYLSSHTIAVGAFLVATTIYVICLTFIGHCLAETNDKKDGKKNDKKMYTMLNNNQTAWEK